MDWSNEKVLEFIQFFEMESLIWDPRNPDHKKKNLVFDAWVRIKNKLKVNIIRFLCIVVIHHLLFLLFFAF